MFTVQFSWCICISCLSSLSGVNIIAWSVLTKNTPKVPVQMVDAHQKQAISTNTTISGFETHLIHNYRKISNTCINTANISPYISCTNNNPPYPLHSHRMKTRYEVLSYLNRIFHSLFLKPHLSFHTLSLGILGLPVRCG